MKNHFCTASFAFSIFIREAIHKIRLIKVSEMFLASRAEVCNPCAAGSSLSVHLGSASSLRIRIR